MEQNVAKRVPYGIQDFVQVIEQNCYYVDKTTYIPKLEDCPNNLFCIRPRRFGKSVFLSMLHAYYDCRTKDKFQERFGDLWIGKHPTPLQGRYQVMHLDFSQVGGSIENLEEKFNFYLGVQLNGFIRDYLDFYSEKVQKQVEDAKDAGVKLAIIQSEARSKGYPLYLIIDEYDNFTNTVLNEQGEDVYWAITHAEGFYRDIFKKFKGSFERIFMMGVSPVTLDDVTSGYNIGWHISTKEEFNQMLGFSTEDVREMFTYYKNVGRIPADSDVEAIIQEMKPWYDNYCFSKQALDTQSKVFNCDMVLYFLRNYMSSGESPEEMVDPNTKTDYNKMKKLLQLDKLDGNRKGVIRTIIENGEIIGKIAETFPARMLTKPRMFVSLLFYYGMLTIKGTKGDRLILGIPNNNVRKQYYEYLMELYEEKASVDTEQLEAYYYDMAYDGKWHDGLQFLADAYTKISSVRDGIEAERNLQGFFMAYLSLNGYYYTAPELELNHGYCDFFLLPDLTHYPTKHCYIIELKVLPKSEFNAMSKDGKHTKAELQWAEAVEQIKRYAEAPRVEALRQGTTLHKIIMQFEGWELKRMEEV
uniref:ATP-binding protein n=1 Tax=Prevotella sp. TaxID=59823 RepID=UPI003FEE6CDD